MSTKQTIGAILTLIGSGLVLTTCLLRGDAIVYDPPRPTAWMMNLTFAAIALIGGFLGLNGKKFGGVLAFLIGLTSIALSISTMNSYYIYYSYPFLLEQYSLLFYFLGTIRSYISIEAFFMVGGGIMIIVYPIEITEDSGQLPQEY